MKRKSIRIAVLILCLLFLFPSSVKGETLPSINEFLVDPTSPDKEWVEIYNPDGVDLKDYWFDDDTSFDQDVENAGKKSFSSLTNATNNYTVLEFSLVLNNDKGDFVVLFKPDGTIIDQFQYDKNPGKDITIGRYPDGTGEFGIMQANTKGAANSQIVVSPTPMPTPTLEPTPSSTPSKTPTPTKSPTPTKEPTVTKTPTPIKSTATPIKIPTPTPKKEVLAASLKKVSSTPTPKITKDLPTPILGTKSDELILDELASLKKKSEEVKENDIKVLGVNTSLVPWIFIGTGSIFLLSCGILAFVLKRKNQT